MWLIRRRLVAAVLAVVVCHLAGVSSALVCQTGGVESPGVNATVCTRGHDSNGGCPMHKAAHSSAGTPPATNCHFRRCRDDASGALTIGYWAGPLVSRLELPMPASLSASFFSIPVRVLDATRPPVYPPPRA